MEPPADPADSADPARVPQLGKWALVRSLNQAFKTYAVLPVRPGPGGEMGGGRRLVSGLSPHPTPLPVRSWGGHKQGR